MSENSDLAARCAALETELAAAKARNDALLAEVARLMGKHEGLPENRRHNGHPDFLKRHASG